MQLAKDYPVYCPNCGERRLTTHTRDCTTTIFVTADAENQTIKASQDIDRCLRCGLYWTFLKDPAAAFLTKLENLSDKELLTVIKFFYPIFKDFITQVATSIGKSVSHVQRVIYAERKSAEVDVEIIKQFRIRVVGKGSLI